MTDYANALQGLFDAVRGSRGWTGSAHVVFPYPGNVSAPWAFLLQLILCFYNPGIILKRPCL